MESQGEDRNDVETNSDDEKEEIAMNKFLLVFIISIGLTLSLPKKRRKANLASDEDEDEVDLTSSVASEVPLQPVAPEEEEEEEVPAKEDLSLPISPPPVARLPVARVQPVFTSPSPASQWGKSIVVSPVAPIPGDQWGFVDASTRARGRCHKSPRDPIVTRSSSVLDEIDSPPRARESLFNQDQWGFDIGDSDTLDAQIQLLTQFENAKDNRSKSSSSRQTNTLLLQCFRTPTVHRLRTFSYQQQ